jgi:hypothetical protein
MCDLLGSLVGVFIKGVAKREEEKDIEERGRKAFLMKKRPFTLH